MDYKPKIQEKITQCFELLNAQQLEELYNKLNDFLPNEERDNNFYINEIINNFFSYNDYYYITTTNLYVEYKNIFKIINENDMIFIILQFLTNYHQNIELNTTIKQKLKNKILKKIKEKPIYNNIPDSNTLQNILNFLYPNIFNNKNYAKYFMITLGDIIMKKTDLFFFIPSNIKPLIKKINKYVSLYFHSINLFNHYKFQYYDHLPEKSRIIKFNNINLNHFNIPDEFYNNLICIALHYSTRYSSSDDFLLDPTSTLLQQDVLWIKNTNKEDIIKHFIDKYIYIKNGHKINEKDMLFLWKDYLKTNEYINIFQKNSDFTDALSKNIGLLDGYYFNISSLFLPYVYDFKDFWNKYMYVDYTEFDYEISEIFQLFIETYKDKLIDEQAITDIINYYYPHILVENKIKHFGCTLWNKKKEIDTFLINNNHNDVNELYHTYCNTFKNKKKISKTYFTNYYLSTQIIK